MFSREKRRRLVKWILSPFLTKEIVQVRECRGLGWNSPDYTGNDRTYGVYSIFGFRLIEAIAARDGAWNVIRCFEWFEKLRLRGNGEAVKRLLNPLLAEDDSDFDEEYY